MCRTAEAMVGARAFPICSGKFQPATCWGMCGQLCHRGWAVWTEVEAGQDMRLWSWSAPSHPASCVPCSLPPSLWAGERHLLPHRLHPPSAPQAAVTTRPPHGQGTVGAPEARPADLTLCYPQTQPPGLRRQSCGRERRVMRGRSWGWARL